MELIIYQVDAFSDRPFGGNPAGVVPDAKGLSKEQMQKIAREMNLSETAFIIPKDRDNYEVRFFSPKCEIDLCGHATIAAFYTLAYKGYIENIQNGIVKVCQHTKAGKLPVEIYFVDGKVDKVMMYQSPPKFIDYVNELSELADALGIDKERIGLCYKDAAPEIIYTGLKDIILPLKDKNTLDSLKVNLEKVMDISKRYNVVGIHAFTVENINGNESYYCRNFAPLVGIDEETATGTSNGALIYYLKRNNFLSGNKIISNQGESLDRLSKIYCEIECREADDIVKVGGKACIIIEGVLII